MENWVNTITEYVIRISKEQETQELEKALIAAGGGWRPVINFKALKSRTAANRVS